METLHILYEDFPAQKLIHDEINLFGQGPGTKAQPLRAFLGLPDLAEAEARFEAALPQQAEVESRRLSATLREINNALLETEEERDYFFSCLSPKKAELLREMLPAYLAEVGNLNQALDVLTDRLQSVHADTLVLIPFAATPSRFFEELTRKLAGLLGSRLRLGTWAEALGHKPGRPLVVTGEAGQLWQKLSQRMKRASRTREVGIAFCGDTADRQALKLALARAGLALDESTVLDKGDEPETPTPWQRIRQARRIDWPRRLGIETQWRLWQQNENPDPNLSVEATLLQKKWVTEAEAPLLEAAGNEPSAPTRQVALLPFQDYPPLRSRQIFYFFNAGAAGKALLLPETRSLLSQWEKERLWDNGFPVATSQQGAPPGRGLVFQRGQGELPRARVVKLASERDEYYRGQWNESLRPPLSLSASQLSSFGICPAQYFFSRRLKLNPQEKLWETSALVYGSLAHSTLEKWIAGPERTAEKAVALFGEALAQRLPLLPDTHPLRMALGSTFAELAPALNDLETELTALFGPRDLVAVEAPFSWAFRGVTFTGRIDRVDRLGDGSLLVLDYKTGTLDFSPEQITDGRDYQVPLYLFAAEPQFKAPVSAFLYYDLKKRELKRGLVKKEKLREDGIKRLTRGHAVDEKRWSELLTAADAHLSAVLSELQKGEWRPRPSSECDSCRVFSLCRRGKSWPN